MKIKAPFIALCIMYKAALKSYHIKFYSPSYLFFRFVKMFHDIVHSFSNSFLDLSSIGF